MELQGSQTATETPIWLSPEKLNPFSFYDTKNGSPLGSMSPVIEL